VCDCSTLGEYRDFSGVIGDNRLVVVIQQFPVVKVVATSHDRVGNLGSVIEGGGQATNLTAHHDQLLGEKPGHEGPGLVSDTEDLNIVEALPGSHFVVQSRSDVLTDAAVNCSGQTSVGCQRHVQLLGLGGLGLDLGSFVKSLSCLTQRSGCLQFSLSLGKLGCGHHLHGLGDFLDVRDGLQSQSDELQVGHLVSVGVGLLTE